MSVLSCDRNETVLAIRRACDRSFDGLYHGEAAAVEFLPRPLIKEILACLPVGVIERVTTPADATSNGGIALLIDPSFDLYVAEATEYWESLFLVGQGSLERC